MIYAIHWKIRPYDDPAAVRDAGVVDGSEAKLKKISRVGSCAHVGNRCEEVKQ